MATTDSNGASNALKPVIAHDVGDSVATDIIELSNTELDMAITTSNDMEDAPGASMTVEDLRISAEPLKMVPAKTTPVKSTPKNTTAAIKKTQSDMMLLRGRSALPTAAAESSFEWRGINVYVGSGKNRKQILHDFNGSIKSGELLALMGGTPLLCCVLCVLYAVCIAPKHFQFG